MIIKIQKEHTIIQFDEDDTFIECKLPQGYKLEVNNDNNLVLSKKAELVIETSDYISLINKNNGNEIIIKSIFNKVINVRSKDSIEIGYEWMNTDTDVFDKASSLQIVPFEYKIRKIDPSEPLYQSLKKIEKNLFYNDDTTIV